jgi:alkylation response protein AidB-like acyl-CoA dehydrogenase
MMVLVLDDEQRLLQDSVQIFLDERAPVAHLRQLRDSADATGFCRKLWAEFAEQGYSAMLVPEAYGGLGLGVIEASIVSEQLGRTLTPSPFLSTAVLGAWAISHAGSDAQKARLLPRVAKSEAIVTLAVDEHVKHRPSVIATLATRDGDDFRLDGRKVFVLDAHVADFLIVVAQVPGHGLTLFLVESTAAGLTIERTSMVDAHNAGYVHLNGVRVGTDSVLGFIGGGADLLEKALDVGSVVVAAQLLGLADEVFGRTVAFLKQRKQIDRLIGEFQALQHRVATLYCDIELTRALVMKAVGAVDVQAPEHRRLTSQAKARACLTANTAVQEAVQMHGGMGMTDAFDVGLFMKRARVLQELFGDAAYHAQRVANLGGY